MPERHIVQRQVPAAARGGDDPARRAAHHPRWRLHHQVQHTVVVVLSRNTWMPDTPNISAANGQPPPLQFMVTGVFYEQLLGRR